MWRKALFFVAALLLQPTALALARTIRCQVLFTAAGRRVLDLPAPVGWCVVGVCAAGLSCVSMKLPMRGYVWTHEWTHAIFAWATGSRVLGLKIRATDGSVKVGNPNALQTLAPYFFPLHAFLLLAVRGAFVRLLPIRGTVVETIAFVLIGAAFGLHLFFTVNALCQRQTDLDLYGFFFSVVFSVVCGLLCVVVLLAFLLPESASDVLSLIRSLWSDTHARLIDELFFAGRVW